MKILFVSLGCDKNLVDSEHMLKVLDDERYEFTDDPSEADVIVVNTCCFISDAMEESIDTLIDLGRYKSEGKCKALIAAGCLAQRYAAEIRDQIPEVDGIVGTTGFMSIAEAVKTCLDAHKYDGVGDSDYLPKSDGRVVTTGGHYAYLKIADGCDKYCTYCVIPYIRGRYRSVPIEELLSEAQTLVDGGVKELILVAQETTLYGTDLYGKKSLHKLIRELSKLEELKWIRILYAYPEEIYDELIEEIRNNPKVCHYIDMPIQHCNDEILKSMGRKTNKASIVEIINRLRAAVPDMAIRTTLICGFPGETDEQAKELVEFVREMRFDRLGAFTYSAQEGTKAAEMPCQIEQDIMQERYKTLMETQQEISLGKNRELIGRTLRVFIEGRLTDEKDVYVGRSYRDNVDVDGYVFVSSFTELFSGRFVDVEITGAKEYDLIGEVVYESTE